MQIINKASTADMELITNHGNIMVNNKIDKSYINIEVQIKQNNLIAVDYSAVIVTYL